MGVLATGAIVAGGGLTAAGCGSSSKDGGGSTDVAILDKAAAATGRQQSFHLVTSATQSIQGKSFTVRSEGDVSGRRSRQSMDFGAILNSFGGASDPTISGFLKQVGGASALKADLVTDGKSLLIRMPAIQRGLKTFAHRDVPPWASVDISKIGKLAGVDLNGLLSSTTGSGDALGYLKALTGDLKKIGSENIDGTATTHYRGTLDFDNIPAGVPAKLRKTLQQTAALLKKATKSKGATKFPVDVWVDGQNLVRREVIKQSVMGATSTTTVNFSDYGKAVKVTIPPASQRFDALALVEQLAPGMLGQVAKQAGGGTTTQ